jgi:hypothetical protein
MRVLYHWPKAASVICQVWFESTWPLLLLLLFVLYLVGMCWILKRFSWLMWIRTVDGKPLMPIEDCFRPNVVSYIAHSNLPFWCVFVSHHNCLCILTLPGTFMINDISKSDRSMLSHSSILVKLLYDSRGRHNTWPDFSSPFHILAFSCWNLLAC